MTKLNQVGNTVGDENLLRCQQHGKQQECVEPQFNAAIDEPRQSSAKQILQEIFNNFRSNKLVASVDHIKHLVKTRRGKK